MCPNVSRKSLLGPVAGGHMSDTSVSMQSHGNVRQVTVRAALATARCLCPVFCLCHDGDSFKNSNLTNRCHCPALCPAPPPQMTPPSCLNFPNFMCAGWGVGGQGIQGLKVLHSASRWS